jgi:hypothetical protein
MVAFQDSPAPTRRFLNVQGAAAHAGLSVRSIPHFRPHSTSSLADLRWHYPQVAGKCDRLNSLSELKFAAVELILADDQYPSTPCVLNRRFFLEAELIRSDNEAVAPCHQQTYLAVIASS